MRIVVADLAVSIARFRALAGADAVSVFHGIPRVSLKGTVFELIGPDNDDLRRHLAARGEGVLSLKLRGSTPRALDPKRLHGAELSSYNDHRVLMALAIAGSTATGVTELSYPHAYRISYPEFADHMNTLGIPIAVTSEVPDAMGDLR